MKKRSEIKCKCGSKNCKRVIKSTPEGKLYVENLFTCGYVHEQIKKAVKLKEKLDLW